MRRLLIALGALLVLPQLAAAQTPVKLKAGMVTGIDQVGLPIALERGFFEKHGLDVTIARPYATGVDALNALQAGESEIVQVGVPMIGAVLRGMDLVALKDVPGAVELVRGGDTIAYLGYNVGLRPWVEKNGETIEKFLAAVSEADKWMRANPKQAAQIATRWIPGLKQEVAEAAMEFNIQQNDRRLSAHNFRALWKAQDTLHRLGVIKSTFDVNKHIEAKHIVNVMAKHPDLFSDMPPIPADVAVKPGYVFKP